MNNNYNKLIEELINTLNNVKGREKDVNILTEGLVKFIKNKKDYIKNSFDKGFKYDIKVVTNENDINILQWNSDRFIHSEYIIFSSDDLIENCKSNKAKDQIGFQKVAMNNNNTVKQQMKTKIYSSCKLIVTNSIGIKKSNDKEETEKLLNFIIFFKPNEEIEFVNSHSSKLNNLKLFINFNTKYIDNEIDYENRSATHIQINSEYLDEFYGVINHAHLKSSEQIKLGYEKQGKELNFNGLDENLCIDEILQWVKTKITERAKILNTNNEKISIDLIYDKATGHDIVFYRALQKKINENTCFNLGLYDLNQTIADAFEINTGFAEQIDRAFIIDKVDNLEELNLFNYEKEIQNIKTNISTHPLYEKYNDSNNIVTPIKRLIKLFELMRTYTPR